jgi:hypothetical protein
VKQEVNKVTKPSKNKKKRAGRPALEKQADERDQVRKQSLQFKSIIDWNRKLEHMHTILTSEDSNCNHWFLTL